MSFAYWKKKEHYIEAYTTVTNNGYAFPFGIYDDTLVGFVMIGYVFFNEVMIKRDLRVLRLLKELQS